MSILILTQNLGISNCIITSNFIYISSFSSPSTLSAYFLASFLTQQDGYKPPKVLLKNLTRVHTYPHENERSDDHENRLNKVGPYDSRQATSDCEHSRDTEQH